MDSKELYLLQDGTHADPGECERGKDGVLRHKNGLAVAVDQNGEPQTIGKNAELHGNVEAAKTGEEAAAAKQADAPAPASRATTTRPDLMDRRGDEARTETPPRDPNLIKPDKAE